MFMTRSLMMCFAAMLLTLGLSCPGAHAADEPQPEIIPEGYHVETIKTPKGVTMEIGALAFRPNGHLLVGTRYGQIWDYIPDRDQWTLFADGLNTPLGFYVDHHTGAIYVAQKPELTELIDTNGDDHANIYRSICHAWGYDGNYHEFVFGPVRDAQGNFYLTLNLGASGGGPGSVRGSVMGRPSKWRGWCVKITPDGRFIPFANGFRSPAGIGMSPKGDLFVIDNQGDWIPTSNLEQVLQGHFYGHPSSLRDDPRFKGKNLNKVPIETFKRIRTNPAIWFPYGTLANSPGNPVWDTSRGKFGPFEGQIFLGDQTKANVLRVSLEKVHGQYQGVCFNFIHHLQCGIIRAAFGPDGSLWVGQTNRGWGSVGSKPFGLQRITYDGHTVPFEIKTIHATHHGFDLTFTKPVEPQTVNRPSDFQIKHWGYDYHPQYGSKRIDLTNVTPTKVQVSNDGLAVRLTLPDMVPDQVYKITASRAASRAGRRPSTDTGFYTLNIVP